MVNPKISLHLAVLSAPKLKGENQNEKDEIIQKINDVLSVLEYERLEEVLKYVKRKKNLCNMTPENQSHKRISSGHVIF